jgi:DNA-directed RNA polymerase subunit RPC12/RpoP
VNVMSVSCSKCGAPLNVPQSVNFVTCTYCGSSLEVKNNGGVIYTEILNRIGSNTDHMALDLRAIRIQMAVDALDAHWREYSRQFTRPLDDVRARMDKLTAPIRAKPDSRQWRWTAPIRVQLAYKQLVNEYTDALGKYKNAEQGYLAERDRLQNS